MKVLSNFKLALITGLMVFAGCAIPPVDRTDTSGVSRPAYPDLRNSTSVPHQQPPPEGIHSIQLYRGDIRNAPVIELSSGQQLTLTFDELGLDTRTFRVRFQHFNADWSPSNLLPNFYQRGFSEDIISSSQPSHVQRPAYTHYTYQFPNENIEFLASGNYLIEVYDFEQNEVLFSLPFFIQENTGGIELLTEELFGLDDRHLLHHQLFATYTYPDFVTMPDIDLETRFVQNHFWGRARMADEIDISNAGEIRSYLSRDEAWPGRFEFRSLDIRRFQQEAGNILEYRPEATPPQIIMERDVVNLDISPGVSDSHRFGAPESELDARYADVYFELEIPASERTGEPVYLIGPFNNWGINEQHRMVYNRETDRYTGNAVIKEGLYDYKYAVVENGRVNDLRLDASFAESRQIYHTFIYYFDPQYQTDRLLKVYRHTTR